MTDSGALRRVLGPGTLALIFANGTIGAGIFAVPGLVAVTLGDATALGYAICAVLVMLIFLCFAEVGSRVHASGGAYAYVEAAFGPFAGFIAANLMWFGFAACSDAALADVLVSALATAAPILAQPVPRAAALITLFAFMAGVNILGVKTGARLVVILTVLKLLPLLLLLVLGIPHIDLSNLIPSSMPSASLRLPSDNRSRARALRPRAVAPAPNAARAASTASCASPASACMTAVACSTAA